MGQPASSGLSPRQAPASSSLYDVLDLVLDKGLVVDAYVRVSLVGIELITVDARIVIASVDTYLRFAEATNRLDLEAKNRSVGLPEMVGAGGSEEGGGGSFAGNIGQSAVDRVADYVTPESGSEEEEEASQQSQGDKQQ